MVYLLLFHVTHQAILDCYDARTGSLVPLRAMGSLQLFLFLLAVILHCRQVEWTTRLDFLWQSQVNTNPIAPAAILAAPTLLDRLDD